MICYLIRQWLMLLAFVLLLPHTASWCFAEHDARPVPEHIQRLPYERRVCRLYFHCLSPVVWDGEKELKREPAYGLSPEELTDIVADMGTEVWSTATTWPDHGVYWPSDMVKRVPAEQVPSDFLPRIIERGHQREMMMLALEQLAEPENQALSGEMGKWVVRPLEGHHWGQMSYNSPYLGWMNRFMREYVEVGKLDGFWLDSAEGAGDVGPFGGAAYRRDTGKDPPSKIDWDSQEFKEWFAWRYNQSINFFNQVPEKSLQYKPYTVSQLNYHARPMQRRWDVAHPLRHLGEINFYPAIEGESSIYCKVARALTPRTEMWMWAHWHVAEIAHGVLPYCDPDRAIAKGLRSIAHGLCPCYGGRGSDIVLWKETVKATFDELKQRRPFMDGETVKYAAVLVSQQSRDFHDPMDMWNGAIRMASLQTSQHLLTDVVFDNGLTLDHLSQYPVVILSRSTCLSDEQCDVLREYVRQGGTLLATMDTSLFDEWGNRRDNFGLADLFGVDYVGLHEEAAQILVCQSDDLKKRFGLFVNFVAPSVEFTLRENVEAEVLLTKSSSLIYSLSVKSHEFDSGIPAVIRRRFGKGTVYYCGPDIAAGYARDKIPQVARFVSYLQLQSVLPPVEFTAPKLLQVTALRPEEKRMFVHLVNITALAPTSDQMAPLANIGLRVHDGKVQRASLGIAGKDLVVENNAVNVPAVGYGEVIVIDLE